MRLFKRFPEPITAGERDYLDIAVTSERLKKNPHLLEDIERKCLQEKKIDFRRILDTLHLVPYDPYGDRDVLIPELRRFVKEQKERDAYYRALRKAGNKRVSANLRTISNE